MSDQLRPRSNRSELTTIARHGRLRKSSPIATVVKFLAATLAVLLVSGVSVAAMAVWNVASSVKPGVTLANETEGPASAIGVIRGGVNLLLVGSDSRAGQGDAYGDPDVETAVLNDVTMLMHIAEDHSSATVISFPRDTYVSIPECPDPTGGTFDGMNSQKINTTLSYGGLSCTVATVEELTGLRIPFAALVQFNGVAAMSEAVGGVPVCIAEPIEDVHTDLSLPAGVQTLKGVEALQFLRTRHGVGDGSDLGRISNQQVFLSSLVRTLKSKETLSDPIKVYSIAKVAAENMELSNSLNNIDTMVSIALALKEIPLDKVVFVQYPTGSVEGGLMPDEEAAGELMAAINADVPPALNPDDAPFLSVPDPNAPVEPAPGATLPTDEASGDGEATSAPDNALPGNVYGQTADEHTCSAGRSLEDQ